MKHEWSDARWLRLSCASNRLMQLTWNIREKQTKHEGQEINLESPDWRVRWVPTMCVHVILFKQMLWFMRCILSRGAITWGIVIPPETMISDLHHGRKRISSLVIIYQNKSCQTKGDEEKNAPMPSRIDKLGLIMSLEFTKKISPMYKWFVGT